MLKVAKNNLTQEEFLSFINSGTNKGQTPLHYASFVGNIKLIKLLIENGADISIKTNNKFNMLHLAVMGKKITSFYYFIKQYKIDINSIGFPSRPPVARCPSCSACHRRSLRD